MLLAKPFHQLNDKELAQLFIARSNPKIAKHFNYATPPLKDYQKIADSVGTCYAVFSSSDRFLGAISFKKQSDLKAEFGLFKNPKIEHLGSLLMTKMIELALNQGFNNLIAKADINNSVAINLYKKFGFKEVLNSGAILTLEKSLLEQK